MFEVLKQLLKRKETDKPASPLASGSREPSASVPAPAPAKAPACVAPPRVAPSVETDASPVKRAKKRASKKGRHGIPLFSEDEDFGALFGEEAPRERVSTPLPRPKPRAVAPPPVKKRKSRDRNGILRLEDEKNLFALMEEEAHREGDRVVGTPLGRRVTSEVPPLKKIQKDRHGLPIIEHGQLPSSKESDEFAALLASSLSEKSGEVLLREKVDTVGASRPITLKERLKRYPPAQGQLDLHGFTAAKADQTAEHYVRRAFSVGTYTLRLIVGKGLHSEHGAVLPDTIADRMTTLKQEGIVLAWEWGRGKKSKSGSILVYLNNYNSSRHKP